jgi:hypothetical protein
MRFGLLCLLSASVACDGCGGGGSAVDATPISDAYDPGTCGTDLRFTGEIVDWDVEAAFCGIFDAHVAVRDGGPTANTAPNGRYDVCVSADAQLTLADVTPSTVNSECTTPPSTYPLPLLLVGSRAAIFAGGFNSARAFTTAREATLGLTIDAAKAHVLVHVDGIQRAVALAAAHDAAQANAATTWAAGDTGHEVFFPNVDPTGGATVLSVTGGAIGSGTIPLEPGKITEISVLAQ